MSHKPGLVIEEQTFQVYQISRSDRLMHYLRCKLGTEAICSPVSLNFHAFLHYPLITNFTNLRGRLYSR
jgi:hypothetical protein